MPSKLGESSAGIIASRRQLLQFQPFDEYRLPFIVLYVKLPSNFVHTPLSIKQSFELGIRSNFILASYHRTRVKFPGLSPHRTFHVSNIIWI